MKEFLNAIHGDFSIITKKDGTFSDETANYRKMLKNDHTLFRNVVNFVGRSVKKLNLMTLVIYPLLILME